MTTPDVLPPIDRRTLLGTGALLAGIGYGVMHLGPAPDGDVAPPRALELLSRLSSVILPQTETSRAGAPADIAFILRGLDAGLLGASMAMLDRVAHLLDGRQRLPFLNLSPDAQVATVRAFDAEVFAPGGPAQTGWPEIKGLILAAYYTSEAGASQELRYELVPGRYDPDVKVGPDTRTYSSDWFGSHPIAIEAR